MALSLEALKERYQLMSEYEEQAFGNGYHIVAGMDEAGRGPLAGPVVAAAVILDPARPVYGVNDSKKLSEKRRAVLKPAIEEQAISFGIGIVDEAVIDRINILEATKEAMKKAVAALDPAPELILIDALTIPQIRIPQQGIIKGDAKSVSIAAASILAKETRDQIMRAFDEIYPQYGFAKHKGYGTKEHIEAIRKYGPCPIHRRSFIKNFI